MAAAGEESEAVPSPANVQSSLRPKTLQARPSRIPSVGDVADKRDEKWTVFSGSQNLPTALNDPSNRELDLFTRTWGSSFVPTASLPASPFPSIEVTDFLRYLRETSSGRKAHRAIVRQLSREESGCGWSPTSPGDLPPLILQLQQDGRDYDVACIPRVFMQRDFSLQDPPTFLEVLPLTQLLPKPRHGPGLATAGTEARTAGTEACTAEEKLGSRRQDKAKTDVHPEVRQAKGDARQVTLTASPERSGRHHSMKLLHEKLTHYLDVVEVHLAYQISQRSDIFFSTLSSQQELQLYIMHVRQEVVQLRQKLRRVSSTSTRASLQLFSKCRSQRRFHSAYEKLKLISTVQQAQPTIQTLLRKSDFVGALELISTTQEVLQEHLHGVHALRHLGSQLAEMENAIEKLMEADLIEFAVQDIRHRLEATSLEEEEEEEEGVSEAEEHLSLVVFGLLRQGKFHFLAALRESLLSFLKAKVKGILSGYLQGESMENGATTLAECMREMDFEAWLDLLTEVFQRMLQCQSAVQGCVGVVADVCARAGGMLSWTRKGSEANTPGLPSPALPPVGPPALSPAMPRVGPPALSPAMPPASVVWGVEVCGEEGEEERFEAEDRLAQFAMDDQLSDARLGQWQVEEADQQLSDGGRLGQWGEEEEEKEEAVSVHRGQGERGLGNGQEMKLAVDPAAITGGGRVGGSPSPSPSPGEMVWEEFRSVGRTTMEQSTQDPEDLQRMEDCSSVANSDQQTSSAIITMAECQQLLMKCQALSSASCQLVHARCAKLLEIRARAGLLEGLVPTDFLQLVHKVEDFVRCSALLTGVQCPNLRIALQSQAKAFLENFHESSRKKMSLLLESERWKQVEVPAEIQGLVNKLERGILAPSSEHPQTPSNELSPPQPPTKFLVIHGNNFAVVGIVQVLVKELVQYCHYANSLPVLINEVMTKLIDIIKFFNSRSCDLMLGGGVVDAVGLKKITARHLGIMMRCLQAISLLIPDLRRHFEDRLERQQHVLLSQFDDVLLDFSRHCNQINSKFMSMMDEVIQRSLAKWEVKQPVPSPSFKTISRKIVQLHVNLVDILPPHNLQALFSKIELIFRSRLKDQLLRLGITNNGSTRHGIVNLELRHCEGVLSSLENISAFGSSLFDVWTDHSHH